MFIFLHFGFWDSKLGSEGCVERDIVVKYECDLGGLRNVVVAIRTYVL